MITIPDVVLPTSALVGVPVKAPVCRVKSQPMRKVCIILGNRIAQGCACVCICPNRGETIGRVLRPLWCRALPVMVGASLTLVTAMLKGWQGNGQCAARGRDHNARGAANIRIRRRVPVSAPVVVLNVSPTWLVGNRIDQGCACVHICPGRG